MTTLNTCFADNVYVYMTLYIQFCISYTSVYLASRSNQAVMVYRTRLYVQFGFTWWRFCLQTEILTRLKPKIDSLLSDPADKYKYKRNLIKLELYFEEFKR